MKKSTQVALGGVCASLCLFFMFLTCIFPFMDYTFPALAGIVLIAVVIENGTATAILVYAAVSILSLFMVPSKEVALLFIGFFGFYPILKVKLDRIRVHVLEYAVKFVVFNVCVIASYLVIIFVFGMKDFLDQTGLFGQYSLIFLLLMGNVMFALYDRLIGLLTVMYITRFRPVFLRKFH